MGFYKEDWRPSSSKSGRWKENKTDGGGEPNHNYSNLACSFSCTLMTKRKVSLPLKHQKLIMQQDKVKCSQWRNRLANKMHALAARLYMKTGCLWFLLSWMVKDDFCSHGRRYISTAYSIQFCSFHILQSEVYKQACVSHFSQYSLLFFKQGSRKNAFHNVIILIFSYSNFKYILLPAFFLQCNWITDHKIMSFVTWLQKHE